MSVRLPTVIVLLLAGAAAIASRADAQEVYPVDLFRDLPASNVFALLESAQPEVTTDRFNNGGLNGGESDRIAGYLSSWTQAQYRIGDVSISSPVAGTAMVFPEMEWWSRMHVATVNMPVETSATGLAIGFDPQPAGEHWSGVLEMSASGGSLAQSASPSSAPPISQLRSSTHGAAMLNGQSMKGRLGLVLGGAWTQSSTLERGRHERSADNQSLFADASFALSPASTWHTLVLAQTNNAVHLQTSYERKDRWRAFGGVTRRSTEDTSTVGEPIEIDRLHDGPVPFATDRGGVESRVAGGLRSSPYMSATQAITVGTDVERTAFGARSFNGVVEERIDGTPARLWRYSSPGIASQRHAMLINGFARDRLALSRSATVDASMRFDVANADADGAANGIRWRTWLPAASLEWQVGTPLYLRFVTGVARSADQPMLGLLAYGDPAAPVAEVFRWDGQPLAGAPIVSRVGPGTGGDPAFVAIDPDLKRPVTDQFAIGLQSQPLASLRLSFIGLLRRQTSLINVVNSGVPLSGYTTFTIPDANGDLLGAADDQLLPVYNRRPETFGQDRYRLTNPDLGAATLKAIVISGTWTSNRIFLHATGAVSNSIGPGSSRGFGAVENDQSIIGELLTDPNAATNGRGHLFNDRAYVIKVTGTMRLGGGVRAGVLARYQDGQPFTRVQIVPDLNQGAEMIQAYSRGLTRFTLRTTLDLRVQKEIRIGRAHLDLISDTFNLLNMALEVEEYVVTGPRFREVTAIQPPRSFHFGARVSF